MTFPSYATMQRASRFSSSRISALKNEFIYLRQSISTIMIFYKMTSRMAPLLFSVITLRHLFHDKDGLYLNEVIKRVWEMDVMLCRVS